MRITLPPPGPNISVAYVTTPYTHAAAATATDTEEIGGKMPHGSSVVS